MQLQRFVLIGSLVITSSALLLGSSCVPPVQGDTEIQNLAPVDAKTLIDQRQDDPNFVIMDVRNPEEFAGGHIADAINVCFFCPTFQEQIAGLDKSRTYLVYCGSDHRAPMALAAMKAAGFTSLYDIAGGLIAWNAAGLPLE